MALGKPEATLRTKEALLPSVGGRAIASGAVAVATTLTASATSSDKEIQVDGSLPAPIRGEPQLAAVRDRASKCAAARERGYESDVQGRNGLLHGLPVTRAVRALPRRQSNFAGLTAVCSLDVRPVPSPATPPDLVGLSETGSIRCRGIGPGRRITTRKRPENDRVVSFALNAPQRRMAHCVGAFASHHRCPTLLRGLSGFGVQVPDGAPKSDQPPVPGGFRRLRPCHPGPARRSHRRDRCCRSPRPARACARRPSGRCPARRRARRCARGPRRR